MPYAPGVTNRAGEIFANAVDGMGDNFRQAFKEARDRKDEGKFLDSTFDQMVKEGEANGNPIDPDTQAQFHSGSLGTKRGVISMQGTRAMRKRQAMQDTMAQDQFERTRGDDSFFTALLEPRGGGGGAANPSAAQPDGGPGGAGDRPAAASAPAASPLLQRLTAPADGPDAASVDNPPDSGPMFPAGTPPAAWSPGNVPGQAPAQPPPSSMYSMLGVGPNSPALSGLRSLDTSGPDDAGAQQPSPMLQQFQAPAPPPPAPPAPRYDGPSAPAPMAGGQAPQQPSPMLRQMSAAGPANPRPTAAGLRGLLMPEDVYQAAKGKKFTDKGKQAVRESLFAAHVNQLESQTGRPATPEEQGQIARQVGLPMTDQLLITREALNNAKAAKAAKEDNEPTQLDREPVFPDDPNSPMAVSNRKSRQTNIVPRSNAPVQTEQIADAEGNMHTIMRNPKTGAPMLIPNVNSTANTASEIKAMNEADASIRQIDADMQRWHSRNDMSKTDKTVSAPDPEQLQDLKARRAAFSSAMARAASRSTPAAGTAPSAAPAASIPTINNQAAYDALPKGAKFRDAKGRLMQKQ